MTIKARGFLIAFAISFAFFYVMMALADARPARCYGCFDWGATTEYSYRRHYRRHSHRHRRHRDRDVVDANGNRPGYAKVVTAKGLTATVAISAREKFQGFIDAVEAAPDLGVGMFVDAPIGNRITDIGCLSRGHMPHSKHHVGLACDFAQVKRNVTHDKFMYHVTDIAQQYGLTDGCTWEHHRGERYTGPDCGHIEVPGAVYAYSARHHRRYARRHHHRHYRYARAG